MLNVKRDLGVGFDLQRLSGMDVTLGGTLHVDHIGLHLLAFNGGVEAGVKRTLWQQQVATHWLTFNSQRIRVALKTEPSKRVPLGALVTAFPNTGGLIVRIVLIARELGVSGLVVLIDCGGGGGAACADLVCGGRGGEARLAAIGGIDAASSRCSRVRGALREFALWVRCLWMVVDGSV